MNSQHYHSEGWSDLINIWYFYNKHIAHIIEHIDPKTLNNECDMDYGQPKTLQFVAEDYVKHLEHHLAQIFSGADPRDRAKWMA